MTELHIGNWFDPHKIVAADKYTMHVLVLTGPLWPTSVPVTKITVLSKPDGVERPVEPEVRDELSYLRDMLPALRGNARSTLKCRLRSLEKMLPNLNKGDYLLRKEFFAEIKRLTRLVVRWKGKQRGYNDILKQRFAYLDSVLIKLTGKPADRLRMTLYYTQDPKNKVEFGKAVVAGFENSFNRYWTPPAGYKRGIVETAL